MEPEKPALSSKPGSEKKSGPWRPTKRQVLWVIGMVVALLTTALLIVNLRPEMWKGLLEERNLTLIAIGVSLTAIIVLLAIGGASLGWTGFQGKTVWDLLQLLIVPLALAVIGLWFAAQQDARQQQIETQRAEAERNLAVQRAQDEALQAYLNQMGSLLLGNGLRKSEEGSEERTLARARTLTVLGRLDTSHKTPVLQFLVEADLVQRVEGRDPIISLTGADLSEADLFEADLSGAHLDDANLSDAYLRYAYLRKAHLDDANLSGAGLRYAILSRARLFLANLRGANLFKANLSDAYLTSANLRGAKLRAANLSRAVLSYANLRGADLSGAAVRPAKLSEAKLSYANLRGANLSEAKLSEAKLSGAVLRGAVLSKANLTSADLSEADLRGADLSRADLSHAKGMSNEELEQETSSLGSATMPDGQRHKSVTTKFVASEFEPAFSFSHSEEWKIGVGQERSDSIPISGPEHGELLFTRPSHVFDPSSPSESTKVSAPETAKEWLSWFQRHPNLETSKPVPVNVGGASGMQIDVAASSTLGDYPRKICYAGPCVPLYPSSGIPIFVQPSNEGWKNRFVIVDVGGQTVIINVFAPPGKFDAYSPKAQKVLDTVEWKSE